MLEEQDPSQDIELENEPLPPPAITNVFILKTENSDEETDDNNQGDDESSDTENNGIPVNSDLEENLEYLNEIAKYNELKPESMKNSPSVINDDSLLDSTVIPSEETQNINTNDSSNTNGVKNMEEIGNIVLYYLVINYVSNGRFLYFKRFKIRKRIY